LVRSIAMRLSTDRTVVQSLISASITYIYS
jgi:hypothetical protein